MARCEQCQRDFKSEAAYQQHLSASKKHNYYDSGGTRRSLPLASRAAASESDDDASMSSVPSSEVSIEITKHCAKRQKQRGITRKELQRAKKHGVRRPAAGTSGTNPHRNLLVHNDVCAVVSSGGKANTMITAWRTPSTGALESVTEELDSRAGYLDSAHGSEFERDSEGDECAVCGTPFWMDGWCPDCVDRDSNGHDMGGDDVDSMCSDSPTSDDE